MSSSTQRQALPAWTTVLDSLSTFAHLPAWLEQAADPERITDALRKSIPEFASGALTLQACRSKHLRLSTDDAGWNGAYLCTIAESPLAEQRSVALLGVLIPPYLAAPDELRTAAPFASDAWCWFVPELRVALQIQPAETHLDALAELTNPEHARALLEQYMEQVGRSAVRPSITLCRPQVLRYHPGLRCTIGYHLTYQADAAAHQAWPPFVVAKTYDDERGGTAYAGMRALWQSPLGTSSTVAIAEPIAYIPERRLLLQGPLPEEQTLQRLIEHALQTQSTTSRAHLNDYVRKTAIGLAELHASGVMVGAVHRWDDELTNVRAFVTRLTTAVPALVPAALPLFTYLEARAAECPPDPLVPCHGTFRPAQVLLDQGRVGFIDFDSCCQAEPAMDLALFMVALMDSGMSTLTATHPSVPDGLVPRVLEEHLTQLEAIAETFLSHYAGLRPVASQRVALWQALNTLELVARSWDRVKPKRLTHTIAMLERQLRVLGGETMRQ